MIVMEFADQGNPRAKNPNAISYLKYYGEWRKV